MTVEAIPTHSWNGQAEEGDIPRPGAKKPWRYRIVATHPPEDPGFAWSVYSDGAFGSRWRGISPTIEYARLAAAQATIPRKLPPPR